MTVANISTDGQWFYFCHPNKTFFATHTMLHKCGIIQAGLHDKWTGNTIDKVNFLLAIPLHLQHVALQIHLLTRGEIRFGKMSLISLDAVNGSPEKWCISSNYLFHWFLKKKLRYHSLGQCRLHCNLNVCQHCIIQFCNLRFKYDFFVIHLTNTAHYSP